MSKSLSQLAQDSLDVQNACNLGGVSRSYAGAISDLHNFVKGTDAIRNHPINIMWVWKIMDLTGVYGDPYSNDRFSKAQDEVMKIIADARATERDLQTISKEELDAAGDLLDSLFTKE